ncbi:MAG: LemA family protein [Alistipes sp.]|nr:LemA family protein [Alistipes sp.]
MKKGTIILICIAGALLLFAGFCITKYNGLVDANAEVEKKWADVESVYQRRADLIPNLVATVKGYAEHEESTLQAVTDARTRATSITIDPATATPEQMDAWMAAQDEVSGALGRLLAVAESYPDLKANQNFLQLQAQLEGTENRISVERQKYNEAVKEYNVMVRRFPNNIIASMFGFDAKSMFEAQAGAEVAPVVVF